MKLRLENECIFVSDSRVDSHQRLPMLLEQYVGRDVEADFASKIATERAAVRDLNHAKRLQTAPPRKSATPSQHASSSSGSSSRNTSRLLDDAGPSSVSRDKGKAKAVEPSALDLAMFNPIFNDSDGDDEPYDDLTLRAVTPHNLPERDDYGYGDFDLSGEDTNLHLDNNAPPMLLDKRQTLPSSSGRSAVRAASVASNSEPGTSNNPYVLSSQETAGDSGCSGSEYDLELDNIEISLVRGMMDRPVSHFCVLLLTTVYQ